MLCLNICTMYAQLSYVYDSSSNAQHIRTAQHSGHSSALKLQINKTLRLRMNIQQCGVEENIQDNILPHKNDKNLILDRNPCY